ncbi:hypothetical protein GGX14DRAFT_462116, partial [Mycena pura]
MAHPYSGAASYIYANEYPYTPVRARHNDPYGQLESFNPIQSRVDSLPDSHPFNSQTIWSATETYAQIQTQTQFSDDDDDTYGRSRRDSQRRLLPLRVPIAHPYAPALDTWFDDESIMSPATPGAAKGPLDASAPVPRHKRSVTIKAETPVRRTAYAPYDARTRGEERERDRMRLVAAAWRRKIQRRVKRALRRLRRLLDG